MTENICEELKEVPLEYQYSKTRNLDQSLEKGFKFASRVDNYLITHIEDLYRESLMEAYEECHRVTFPSTVDELKFNFRDMYIWMEAFDDEQVQNCFHIAAKIKASEDIPTDYKSTSNEHMKNKNAFENFVNTNLHNPQFKDKFVAFVNGEFQDVGDKRNMLIEKTYDKFGNVDMYVGKVTDQKKIILIDTPEFN